MPATYDRTCRIHHCLAAQCPSGGVRETRAGSEPASTHSLSILSGFSNGTPFCTQVALPVGCGCRHESVIEMRIWFELRTLGSRAESEQRTPWLQGQRRKSSKWPQWRSRPGCLRAQSCSRWAKRCEHNCDGTEIQLLYTPGPHTVPVRSSSVPLTQRVHT